MWRLQSPLHDAVSNGHGDVVSLLLARGADVNAKMHLDKTALHTAAASGRINMVKLLLESGADVNAKEVNGYTPMNGAESKGHADVAKLLKQRRGHAKPKVYTIKRSTGPLNFTTHEEIAAALKAGKVAASDPVWVDGVALFAVKYIVKIDETES